MKIEFENSIRRLSFVLSTGHQNCLDKSLAIYIYVKLLRNTIVPLPYPRSGDSQDQETFLEPSADEQTL